LVALIGLVLLLALAVIYVIRKRHRGEAILPHKMEPPRPPHEIAYEELQRLAASELLAHGEWKAYYSEISEIIRRYVEGRYQIVALELTTTELLVQLEAIEIEEKHQILFVQFLQLCDFVKFAKYIPEEKDNEQVMKWAVQIVDETKWVEQDVASISLEDSVSPEDGNVISTTLDDHTSTGLDDRISAGLDDHSSISLGDLVSANAAGKDVHKREETKA